MYKLVFPFLITLIFGLLLSSTTSNETNTPKSDDGYTVGQSATDLVGFYGATPIVQPTSASQAVVSAVTDGSGGTGAYTNGIAALTGTYNSTILANAIATLALQGNANKVLVNQLRADLVSLGLIKGS